MINNSLHRLFRAEVRLPGEQSHRSFSPLCFEKSVFSLSCICQCSRFPLALANNYQTSLNQKSLWGEFCLLFFKFLVTTTPFGTVIIRRKDVESLDHLNNREMLIFAFLILGTYCQSCFLPAELTRRAAFRLPFAPTGRTSTTTFFCLSTPNPSGKQTEKATGKEKKKKKN